MRRWSRGIWFTPLIALSFGGCFLDRGGTADGLDAGGLVDAGPRPDAARLDAAGDDAGPGADAFVPPIDAGGGVDASDTLDAGATDAGPAPTDAGSDAGPPPVDSGPPCVSTGVEVCDSARVDEDCDGAANEGCAGECFAGEVDRTCMPAAGCAGQRTCGPDGAWGTCLGVSALSECNGMDDDCDGSVDEGSGCELATGANCTYVLRVSTGVGYLICTNDRGFNSARAYCQTFGYDLATVNGSSEDSYLLNQANMVRGSDRFWIGYQDRDSNGIYAWVGGSSSYENSSFPGATGACAVIDTGANDWGDDSCSFSNPFICESPPP